MLDCHGKLEVRRKENFPQDGGFYFHPGGLERAARYEAIKKKRERENIFLIMFSSAVLEVLAYNGHKSGAPGLQTLF